MLGYNNTVDDLTYSIMDHAMARADGDGYCF